MSGYGVVRDTPLTKEEKDIFKEIHDELEAETKFRKQRRDEHYSFMYDFQMSGVVGICQDCGWRADFEHFIIAKRKKIIPVTCVRCLSTNIKIVDER